MNDLIDEFNKSLNKFLIHVFKTTHQYKFFKELKTKLGPKSIILLMDFSQNYEAKYHEEIQAVHFGASKKQISLHTVVMIYEDDEGKLQRKSFFTASDCLRHDSTAVWGHLQPIFKKIKEIKPNFDVIH